MDYLKLDEFRNFTFLNNLKYSPSGANTAVVATKINDNNGYSKAICIDKGDGYFPLTSVTGNVSLYTWLDDRHILFAETRDKNIRDKISNGCQITCFYKISIDGGEASHAFDVDANVTGIELLPNGGYLLTILFDNNRPDLDGKSPQETDALLKEIKQDESFQVIDELPFWYNGRGFINKKRRRLYKYDPQNSLTPLTPPLDDIWAYKLSPCGKYILFTGEPTPCEIQDIKSNLYRLEIETGVITGLLEEKMFISSFQFAGDNLLLAATFGETYYFNEHPNFYLLGNDGSLTLLLEYDRSLGSVSGSDSKFGGGITAKMHNGAFYFTAMDGYKTDIYKLCLQSGKLINVTNFDANIDYFDIRDSGIVFGAMKGLELQEIYELKNGSFTKKSAFNSDVLASKKLSQPEHHILTDDEGVEFEGWVLKPVDYEAGNSYPAILNIHGGPKVAYGDAYFHEMQYWANLNYFVIFCNPRGSDGKGSEFADIRGKYGTIDYDNIMQFTEEMCRKYPAIDISRLGVTGGSYGGFMTNWIVGHTNKFKAAATQRSICNWPAKAYSSDIGYFFNVEQMKADPWSNYEKMWWHSPLKYAPNVTTPTLIIHSDEDYRCYISEAYQWFTALKLHGVETRLHIFHGENHELSRSGKPDSRVRRLEELTNWMNKYLKELSL